MPVSDSFSDPYFSLKNGEAETEYVFFQHNDLPAIFSRLALKGGDKSRSFTIAETGFGTGLNFFVTAKKWSTICDDCTNNANGEAKQRSHLTYYSIEKYPIEKKQLVEIVANWPQFEAFSTPLITQYPENRPGFHQIHFPKQRVTLVLMIGDVCDMLDQMLEPVDAWYLDGFSPSKNPEMWTKTVFDKVAKQSRQGATFATFAAAGFVRRNLQAAGFTVKKAPGFGKKREMLWGFIDKASNTKNLKPWYAIQKSQKAKAALPVAIIGAGVAGLSCALALAQKKMESVIIESGKSVGAGASGNPAGIVLPKINSDLNTESQFYINSFQYAVNQYDSLKSQYPELYWTKNGALQFDSEDKLQKILALSLPGSLVNIVDASQASALAGLPLLSPALYYSQAGTISPKALCEVLLKAAGELATVKYQTKVNRLERNSEHWVLIDESDNGICCAENVVFANAFDVSRLLNTDIYRVEPNRGQLSYMPCSEKSKSLAVNLCGEGYVIPCDDAEKIKMHIVGATYGGNDGTLSENDHIKNECNANALLCGQLESENTITGGRVSFRATSFDHLPVVGPVVDEVFFRQHYNDLYHGRPENNYPPAVYQKGLYLTIGHGSRGLVSCMATSQYLADLISGSAVTASADIVSLLHPSRFLIRGFKKTEFS